MPRYAYVNGRFVPHADAAIHIEDRGYQFADSVYEVVGLIGGGFVDEGGHLQRLAHSLGALRIAPPMSERALKLVMRELVRRNFVRDGSLYLQVTRGVAPRDFKFPDDPKSAIVMTTRRRVPGPQADLEKGVRVVTVPDIRWARRDIKSTGLLAQVLAKQEAAEASAFEAWMIDPEGKVTEGASSNAWIVTADGILTTRPADRSILKGITGNSLASLAAEIGLKVEHRAFSLAEAYEAREAFLTSATTFCLPIVRIDDRQIGDGRPGEIARTLNRRYLDYGSGRGGVSIPWRP